MSKVKGIPRTFWQRYHSWFEGALVIAIVVAIVLFLAWGLNRIGDAARVERTRMSQNALYVCLDRSDGERALLLCLEQNGFTFTFGGVSSTKIIQVSEFWPDEGVR